MKFFHHSFNLTRAGVFTLPAIMLLLAVSGCSILQHTSSTGGSSPEQMVAHQQIWATFPEIWSIHGRISVINDKENWYAKFNWIQEKEDFQISFTGPLGETELLISQMAENISLKTPSYERSSDDLEQLIFQETGWKLPLTSLRYWSHGGPNPVMASQVKYNEQQHISDIYQAGWHIQYPTRMQVEQYWLPKKIIVTEQDVKIKIIITSWHLGAIATGEQEI